MPTRYLTLSIILTVSLLVSCGFQLRGKLEIDAAMLPVHLQPSSRYNTLIRHIDHLLKKNAITTVNDAVDATTVITIEQQTENERVLSLDTAGRPSDYQVTLVTNFSIQRHGETNGFDVSTQDALFYDPSNVLAYRREKEQLLREMMVDHARLILRRLQSLSKGRQ